MRRAAPAVGFSPKLLRHFAIVTVVITSCIAMFADGENRQALADTVHTQQVRNSARLAENEKLGSRALVGTKPANHQSYSSVPVDDAPSTSFGGGYIPPEDFGTELQDYRWSGAAEPEYFEESSGAIGPVGGLASDPQFGGAKGPPKRKPAKRPRNPTQQEIEAMIAASRARANNDISASHYDDTGEAAE